MKHPSITARVLWNPCTLPMLYGLMKTCHLLYTIHHQEQQPPNLHPVLKHWVVCYYGGVNTEVRRENHRTALQKHTIRGDVILIKLGHFDLCFIAMFIFNGLLLLYPPQTKFGGYIGITLSVRPSGLPCTL